MNAKLIVSCERAEFEEDICNTSDNIMEFLQGTIVDVKFSTSVVDERIYWSALILWE
jgi:hypothetical protein